MGHSRNFRQRFGSRRLRGRGLLTALLCALIWVSGVRGAAQPQPKNVLLLFSSIEIDGDLVKLFETNVRARVHGPINFYVSHVANFATDADERDRYEESEAETLRRQFIKVKLDMVLAVSPQALLFMMRHRDTFPGIPIVFTQIGTREFGDRKWPQGVTGVTVPIGIGETIDLALRLHPDTTTVALIGGSDTFWMGAVHSELLRYQKKVKEIDFTGPPSRALLAKVLALPPHSVVLFHISPGINGPDFGGWELLAEVTKKFPTYSAWHGICLDHGCIGGVYGDETAPNVEAAEMAARVLSGERPDNLPVLHDRSLTPTVDWRELQRWNIPESSLPAGTLVLYRQPTFWERDRNYILAGAALIILQALAIAGLLWQRARKRRAEAVLRESEERFRVMADTTPALIWMCDARGKITYLNERWVAFTGKDPWTGYGDSWIADVHPDDVKNLLGALWQALKEQSPFSKEYRLRRSDGVYRWMFDVASPRVNGDGSFAGFIGSAIDVTDQKLAQQALENVSGQLIEAQEKERTRIARDLHDDICQRLALLSMELEQAKRDSNGRVSATRSLEEIRKHCSEIAGDVQSLSHQLHSSKLDYLGAAAAIRGFSKEFSKKYDVNVEFTEGDVPKHLSKDVSLCLFRVAQEALHNAVKYSGARQFKVALSATADVVQLEVTDEGSGFDVDAAKENRGLGLVSMQERVHLVHGKFSIESKPGMGTRIVATVPLVAEHGSSAGDAVADERAGAVGTV